MERLWLEKLLPWKKARTSVSAESVIREPIDPPREDRSIPELMRPGLSEHAAVRTEARAAIALVFSTTPLVSLPALDESLRRSWGYLDPWSSATPRTVRNLHLDVADDRLFLCLMSCHRSGYVRAEAMRLMGEGDSATALPFLLLRLGDWVDEVRLVAESALLQFLTAGNAAVLIRCLELLDRLMKSSRFPDASLQAIETLLRSPACAEALKHGLASSQAVVRRHCYRLAVDNTAMSAQEILLRAIGDHDVMVRRWAYTSGPDVCPELASMLMGEAAKDPYGPFRRLGFEYVVKGDALTRHEMEPFLLDSSPAIRRACQTAYLDRFGELPVEFYRDALSSRVARRVEIGVLGMGEMGGKDDREELLKMLGHQSARVRGAVVRALRMLGTEGEEAMLLELVATDVRSVAREAATALIVDRTVTITRVWEAVVANPQDRILLSVLRLLWKSDKWEQLGIYLKAAGFEQVSVSACAVEVLRLWLARFNQTFVAPTAAERDTLISSLGAVRERLPERLARELSLILEA